MIENQSLSAEVSFRSSHSYVDIFGCFSHMAPAAGKSNSEPFAPSIYFPVFPITFPCFSHAGTIYYGG